MNLDPIKLLEINNIEHSVRTIGDFKDLAHAASRLNLKTRQVLKTMIVEGASGKHYCCLIGGDQKLHMNRLKRVLDEFDVHLCPHNKIFDVTGFHVGAIPPFGMVQQLPTYIDRSLAAAGTVAVGAGRKGTEILLNIADLKQMTKGEYVDIVK